MRQVRHDPACAHSDASCLSAPKSRSKLGGHFYLSSRPKDPHRQPDSSDPMPPMNGAILVNANIIKHATSSAAEAELGGSFFNMKDAVPPIRAALEEMGHPQPPTAIVVDNSTASGIANKTVKQRRSKAVDMRFCWGSKIAQSNNDNSRCTGGKERKIWPIILQSTIPPATMSTCDQSACM